MTTEKRNYFESLANKLNLKLKIVKDETKKANDMLAKKEHSNTVNLSQCYLKPSLEKIEIDKRIRNILSHELIYELKIGTHNTNFFTYIAKAYFNRSINLIEITSKYLYVLDLTSIINII